MSASIFYRISDKGVNLPTPCSSRVWEALHRTFGDGHRSLHLNSAAVPILQGMQYASNDNEFYAELVRLIEKVGAIEVWATW